MADWVIEMEEVTTNDMDGEGTAIANGDTITIGVGGVVAWNTVNANEGIKLNGVTINKQGRMYQVAGTRLLWNDTKIIAIKEGGQFDALGTAAAPCIIKGGNSASTNSHYLGVDTGGKIFLRYATITNFYGIRCQDGYVELRNCSMTDVVHAFYNPSALTAHPLIYLYDTSINVNTVNGYVFLPTGSRIWLIHVIGCALVTTTDNKLAGAVNRVIATFANTTYQGAAIDTDDFDVTTQDLDIRIYGANTVTEGTPLADVGVTIDHPSMDSRGMFVDSTAYRSLPPFLPYPLTDAAGESVIFTLQKTGHWCSELAIGSRTWKYWSDSGQAETGDNRKYTVTLAKVGYVSATDSDWSGNVMTGTLAAITPSPRVTAMEIHSYGGT